MSVATPFISNIKALKPITLDCTSGPVTYDLDPNQPAVSFIRVGNTTNTTTVVAPEGYTIQGASSRGLYTENETIMLILNGTDWGVY